MAITAVLLVLLIIFPFYLTPDLQEFYVSEGGPIQVFSAAGYLVTMTTLIRELDGPTLRRHWYLPVIPLAMCLREMDFHAHFTTYSITKTLLYVSPEVPLVEKIFGVLVFVFLGITGYLLVVRSGRAFLNGLRSFDVTSLAVAAAIASAVLSKALDGAASNLGFLGINVQATLLSVFTEEVLELGIPVFMAIATFSYFDRQRRERPSGLR
ncbi:hypothetical protein [Aliihoeflea sp. PC F10.4]